MLESRQPAKEQPRGTSRAGHPECGDHLAEPAFHNADLAALVVARDDHERRLVEVIALIVDRFPCSDVHRVGPVARIRFAHPTLVYLRDHSPNGREPGDAVAVRDDDEDLALLVTRTRRAQRSCDELAHELARHGIGAEATHRSHRRHDLDERSVRSADRRRELQAANGSRPARSRRAVHRSPWVRCTFWCVTTATEESNRRLLRARDAMDRTYAEPLDIPTLARVAHTSPAHFSRTFRDTFGETPHRYLQRRRVERAMFLLRQTARDVTDICMDVGFTSLGTFSRTFSDIVGTPPTEYRRRGSVAPVPNWFAMAWTRPSSFGEARDGSRK